MTWAEIMPGYTSLFRRLGRESAQSFLGWTGVFVNHHRHRDVVEVSTAGGEALAATPQAAIQEFFLKKEHAVSWRDRFLNAWHGFGWCATAVREAATLQALARVGVGCPEVAAFGEDGRSAFVLVRAADGMIDLRAFLQSLPDEQDRHRLAATLGRELAKLHNAGFDHPDLFAKHILVSRADNSFRICILDWSRSRYRRVMPWRVRWRDLAVLDATLHETLASERLRLRCLFAYLDMTASASRPPLRRLARRIHAEVERLRGRISIREIGQLPITERDQQFVPLDGNRVWVVRSYYEQQCENLPAWFMRLTESAAQETSFPSTLACASGSKTLLAHSSAKEPGSREMPPLAHTLFRLQRFGVPAPRLLAVGWSANRVSAVTQGAATIPLAQAFAKAPLRQRAAMLTQAGRIVRQVHEAGYFLPRGDSWGSRLGVCAATGVVVVAQVEPFLRGSAAWQNLAPTDLHHTGIHLSRGEQRRFLLGYLRPKRIDGVSPSSPAREGQGVL